MPWRRSFSHLFFIFLNCIKNLNWFKAEENSRILATDLFRILLLMEDSLENFENLDFLHLRPHNLLSSRNRTLIKDGRWSIWCKNTSVQFNKNALKFKEGVTTFLVSVYWQAFSYEAGFFKQTILKVHPPTRGITAHATTTSRLECSFWSMLLIKINGVEKQSP